MLKLSAMNTESEQTCCYIDLYRYTSKQWPPIENTELLQCVNDKV